MIIEVGNLRKAQEGIKCDRSSILGNPFKMRSESERNLVCQGYREYLHLIVNTWENPGTARQKIAEKYNLLLADAWKYSEHHHFISELSRIEGIIKQNGSCTLLCWCAPKACHCDILKNYFRWILARTE